MTPVDGTDALVDGVRAGDVRALGRAITLVENGDPAAYEIVRAVYSETGRARAVGVTGPPGAGKSSLVSALIGHIRSGGTSVGVISVDPSSPFTQGALLGDRIRLADHFLDPEVFIRSMGTRGYAGGLAEASLQAVLLLDAAGKDVIFVETVGSGQNDVGVLTVADTVVLVLQPGSGDSVQALKAGVMEIPDVIAVNKSDHPLAQATAKDVRQVLALGSAEQRPPVILTNALEDAGIDELWTAIESHGGSPGLDERRRRNLAAEVFAVASARARRRLEAAVADDRALATLLERVQKRELDPLSAVHEILTTVFHFDDEDGANAR
jgi:LAO/AO transport system kinase